MSSRLDAPARLHVEAIRRLFRLGLAMLAGIALIQAWSLLPETGGLGRDGGAIALDLSLGEHRQRLEEAFARLRIGSPELR